MFGRGGEEAEVLVDAGIPFEIVPGVTSAVAAPAYAGIPLSHRQLTSTIAFVTGHEEPSKEELEHRLARARHRASGPWSSSWGSKTCPPS